MKISFLFIFEFLLCDYATAQGSFSISSLKAKVDSVRNLVHPDLLPPEFNSSALENEYYYEATNEATPTYFRGHVFVLKLRDNCTFFYEVFYKPYNWARIEFSIGAYSISSDTIYLTFKPLLKGQSDNIYISPTLSVSWTLPDFPKYLLVDKDRLVLPITEKNNHYTLNGKSRFDLRSCK